MKNARRLFVLLLLSGWLSPPALGQYLFWTLGDGTLMRSDMEGNGAAPIFSNGTFVYALAVDPVDRQLYIAQFQQIKRLEFDGSAVVNLSEPDRRSLAVDPFERDLYCGSLPGVRRRDLDTGTSTQISSQDWPTSMGLYLPGRLLFYVDGPISRIYSLHLDTLQRQLLVPGPYPRLAIDPVHQWRFVVAAPSASSSVIKRMPVDSVITVDLYTGPRIADIAVDPLAGKVYWTEIDDGRIMRMDLDGQNPELMLDAQDSPQWIAVFHPTDCNNNSLDDWCDALCGVPGGPCDVPGCGNESDCDRNGLLDACEPMSDCNLNTVNDRCELYDGSAEDCNKNSVLDECETAEVDCNQNLVPDDCDLAGGNSADCNGNSVPDECDVEGGVSQDADANGVPDECCPPPCVPDPLIANSFGTCTIGGYFVCDVEAQDCAPERGACEPCGQVRYVSFSIPANDYGGRTAIRIRLDSLHNPSPPPVGMVPDFALIEGQDRYLNTLPGTVSRCCNPNSNPLSCKIPAVSCTTNTDCAGSGVNITCYKNLCPDWAALGWYFRCAVVGCAPEYRDWSDFAGLVTYATGDAVISSSTYSVSHLAASCTGSEAACAAASAPLTVLTERWGNVDCSNTSGGTPNAADIARVSDAVKHGTVPFIKPRAQLRSRSLDPISAANAQDIGRAVDAVKGFQYPFNIKCTTSTICMTNSECTPPATCSENGICTTVKDSCSGLCQD